MKTIKLGPVGRMFNFRKGEYEDVPPCPPGYIRTNMGPQPDERRRFIANAEAYLDRMKKPTEQAKLIDLIRVITASDEEFEVDDSI